MKKAALHNLGCKVNAYETEAMQELLEQNGYEIVPFQEGADIYIINTCTVTNMADRKSRQMIHRAKKMNPDAIVVAAGCYVQAQENSDKIDECIDIVIGNNKKQNLIEILEEYEQKRKEADGVFVQQEVIDINHTKEYEELHLTKTAEHTRAYIKVQDGCNQFCTYCIIPYMRGRVRSRRKEEVVEEVSALAANGYKEVVLTGIHLSSYGVDFEEKGNVTFADPGGSCNRRNRENPTRIVGTPHYHRRICVGAVCTSKNLSAFSSVIAKWLRGDFKADEPKIFSRRIF